jgi:hypothetical protein
LKTRLRLVFWNNVERPTPEKAIGRSTPFEAAPSGSKGDGRTGEGLQQQWALAQDPEEVAQEAIKLRDEGGFTALKLRLGREIPRMISEPSTLFGSRSAMRFIHGLDLSIAPLPRDR